MHAVFVQSFMDKEYGVSLTASWAGLGFLEQSTAFVGLRGKPTPFFPVFSGSRSLHIAFMLDATTYKPSSEVGPLRSVLFSAKGALPGPLLVVSGPEAVLQSVAARFWDLHGLVRMRGSLEFRVDDGVDFIGYADATLTLSDTGDDPRSIYWRVLGRMTALGMIAGRGVPERWVA